MLIWDGRQVNYEGIKFPAKHITGSAGAESRYIMPTMKVEMELHGAAIAVIPCKNDPDTYQLHFNPVAISNVKPTDYTKVMNYRLLDELKFIETFSLLDSQQIKKAFIKIVNALEQLVKIQDKACEDAWVDPQPISIILGQDKYNPVNINAVYLQLFNKTLDQDLQSFNFDKFRQEVQKCDNLLNYAAAFYLTTGIRAIKGFVKAIEKHLNANHYQDLCESVNCSQLFFSTDQKLLPTDLEDQAILTKKFETALKQYTEKTGNDFYNLSNLLGDLSGKVTFDTNTYHNLNKDEQDKVIEIACSIAKFFHSKGHDLDWVNSNIESKGCLVNLNISVEKLKIKKINDRQVSQINSSKNSLLSTDIDSVFLDAAKCLNNLLSRFLLKEGNYSTGLHNFLGYQKHQLAESSKATAREIIDNPDAYYDLLRYARWQGTHYGEVQSDDTSPLNTSFMSFNRSNLDESAQVRETFNNAFQKAYTGSHTRFVMQGLDSSTPPFVIGLLWMAADQFQILYGSRHQCDVEDNKKMRGMIEAGVKDAICLK